MQNKEDTRQQFDVSVKSSKYSFLLVGNIDIAKLSEDIEKLSEKLDIKKEYEIMTKSNNFAIKDLDDESKIIKKDANEIKKFYLKIALISDEEFNKYCNALQLNKEALSIWRHIVMAYFIENAWQTVVPTTPINLVQKVQSWSNCNKGDGTGIYLFSVNSTPMGFVGLTKMDKENAVEMNAVVFKKFRGNGLAVEVGKIFVDSWQKKHDPNKKFEIYAEALKHNIASIQSMRNANGTEIGEEQWHKDPSKEVVKYFLGTNSMSLKKLSNYAKSKDI